MVLPGADLKVYLTAHPEARAGRRAAERGEAGALPRCGRGHGPARPLDSTRAVSPLPAVDQMPADALVIDSTDKDAATVLEEVMRCL